MQAETEKEERGRNRKRAREQDSELEKEEAILITRKIPESLLKLNFRKYSQANIEYHIKLCISL